MSTFQRFRRAISFRRSQRHVPESCRPHQWESDSHKVKSGGISFPVKYIGAQEVAESRGTQICSEAAKILKRNKRRRSRKMTLLVTEDCIRVVDDKTKQLVIDQTIEKVSFCTPDPYNEKLFCYISRDGTSRRWMCQCFSARRDTGERLSHAVGCAFTACLQRKQKQVALKEQHLERQSMRLPSNKDKATAETSQQDMQNKPSTSSTIDPNIAPSTPSASSAQGSPQPSISSSPTISNAPSTLERPEAEPIRKKEKKLHLQSRPRPQGSGPNPFTRHTSLRYRSQPLSLQPLKPGKYEVLADESVVPRLPPQEPVQNQRPTDIDDLLSMNDPTPAVPNTMNNGKITANMQYSGGTSAGLLMTSQHNPNQELQTNSWSNDLKQTNPFQVNGDDFSGLANRHQNTEGKGTNPFKQGEPVHWL